MGLEVVPPTALKERSSDGLLANHNIFSNMHAALFFEGGKVAPKVSQLNFHRLEYAGGIGFRFTIQDTVIMRIDNAVSREGYRFMWTFSNMW